jgi:hypothetical protein
MRISEKIKACIENAASNPAELDIPKGDYKFHVKKHEAVHHLKIAELITAHGMYIETKRSGSGLVVICQK